MKIMNRQVLQFLAVAGLALASAGIVDARPDNRGGYDRGRSGGSKVSVNVGVAVGGPSGFIGVNFGNDRYYTRRGYYYRQCPSGYAVVRPPCGLVVASLPFGYSRVYRGNTVYFSCNNIYYRPCAGGYVVVDYPPAVVAPQPTVIVQQVPVAVQPAPVQVAAPAPVAPANDYQTIQINNAEYQFKDGQFFRKSADGLIWCEAPMGAVTRNLPNDATSVWYQDQEYFDCDGVYFRKTPDGYRVVPAPWKN